MEIDTQRGACPAPGPHRPSGRPAPPRARLGVLGVTTVALLLSLLAPAAQAASLHPSRAGLLRQVRAAQAHGAYHARNEADLRTMRMSGELVRVEGNRDFVLKRSIRFPYARPEVKLFLERLGEQYRAACGQRLVVTSLVRPKNRQPRNASPLSVHPTGMAMDLRRSTRYPCRAWLESVLLSLEDRGLAEAARERYPPHYHVVLFPDPYLDYVAAREGEGSVDEFRPRPLVEGDTVAYRVRRGDSLWKIARRFDTTIGSIQRASGLATSSIRPGQLLQVPVGVESMLTTYRVQRGDSLWGIAHRFGTTPYAIRQVNGLASDTIRPGQELRVPVVGSGGIQLATYRVRRGDSLWEIARRHGTSARDLQRANGLRSSRIKPGQVLRIPDSGR